MRHWSKRRQSWDEWGRQIVSGELLREMLEGPFAAGAKILVEAEKRRLSERAGPKELELFGVVAAGVHSYFAKALPKGWQSKYGEFAVEAIRAADWSEATPELALDWVFTAGVFGQGEAALKALGNRFSDRELADELAARTDRLAGRRMMWTLARRWIGWLGDSPVVNLWAASPAGKRALAGLLSGGQAGNEPAADRWKAAAELLGMAASLSEWLGSEAVGKGSGGSVGPALRKWIRASRRGDSLAGIEAAIEASIRGLSGDDRHLWALEAEEMLLDAKEKKGVSGVEPALRFLEAQIMGESLGKTARRSRARSV